MRPVARFLETVTGKPGPWSRFTKFETLKFRPAKSCFTDCWLVNNNFFKIFNSFLQWWWKKKKKKWKYTFSGCLPTSRCYCKLNAYLKKHMYVTSFSSIPYCSNCDWLHQTFQHQQHQHLEKFNNGYWSKIKRVKKT